MTQNSGSEMNEDSEEYTLLHDEGVDYVRDAFREASEGEVVKCFFSDDSEETGPVVRAVMISPQRYEELLEIEWMYQELQK